MTENVIDVKDADSSPENTIPQSRFNEVNNQKKALEEKVAELEAKSKEQKVDVITPKFDPADPVQVAQKVVAEAFAKKEAETTAKRRQSADSEFFSKLSEEMPKPDMDELKEFAKSRGVTSLQDAYYIKHRDDIIDVEKRTALIQNKGNVSPRASVTVPKNFSEGLKNCKTKGELNDYLKSTGLAN